jgi:ABC-2 type transport system permease protein
MTTTMTTTRSSRLAFGGVLRSELLKLATMPSLRWLALAVVGLGALGGVMFGAGGPAGAVTGAASLAGSGFALLAGLSIAGEYASGSIRLALTAVPRRMELFLGKSVVTAVVGLVLGALAAVLAVAVTGGPFDGIGTAVVGCAAYVAVAGLFGLFVGALVRGVAPTVVSLLVAVFLLPAMAGSVRVGDLWLADFLLGESGPTLAAGTAAWAVPLGSVVAWLAVAGVLAAARLRATDA